MAPVNPEDVKPDIPEPTPAPTSKPAAPANPAPVTPAPVSNPAAAPQPAIKLPKIAGDYVELKDYNLTGAPGGGFQPTIPSRYDLLPLDYAPTYWEKPENVAQWYNKFLSGQALPEGVDPKQLEAAYKYYSYVNEDKPWYTWNYLNSDDAARQYLQGLPTPAGANLNPEEAQYVSDLQKMAQAPQLDESKVPTWQRMMMDFMSNPELQAGAMALPDAIVAGAGGAGAGLMVGGPIGALLGGVLGFLTPMVMAEGGAVATDERFLEWARSRGVPEWLLQGTKAIGGGTLGLLNVGAETIEQGTGATAQIFGSLLDPKEYGALSELLNADGIASALQAGRSTYEVTPTEVTNIFPWLEGLLTGKPAHLAEAGEVWRLPEQNPETGEWMYYPDPVKIQGAQGLAALVEGRRLLLQNKGTPEEIFMMLSQRYGLSGQFRDLLYQSLADPNNAVIPMAQRAGVGAVGKVTGLDWLYKAADIAPAHAGAIETVKIGSQMLKTGQAGLRLDQIKGMDAFTRWAAGLDKQGNIKALEANKGKFKFIGQTPESRAWETLGTVYNNIGALFNSVQGGAAEKVQALKAWANTPAEAAAVYGDRLGGTEGTMVAMILRDFMAEGGKPDTLLQIFQSSEPQRIALQKIADALGIKIGNVVEQLREAGDNTDVLAQQVLDKAMRSNDPAARALVDSAEAGEFNGQKLKSLAEVFVKGDAPYHEKMFDGQLAAMLIDHSETWLKKHYDLQPSSKLTRLAETMKGAQSLVFLGLNPFYFINNFINGEVTMAAEGVLGLWAPGEVDRFLDRFGVDPFRLKAGIGFGKVGEEGGVSGETGKVLRKATTASDTIQKASQAIRKVSNKIGIFSNWSQDVEQWQSKRAYATGMRQFILSAWRPGRGIDYLPPALESRLKSIDPRLPAAIYGAVQSGLANKEILENKLFAATMSHDLLTYLDEVAQEQHLDPANVRDNFAMVDIEEFNRRLESAHTPEQIDAVFDDMDRKVQQHLNEQVAQEAQARAEAAANEVAAAAQAGESAAAQDGQSAETVAGIKRVNGMAKAVDLFDEVDLQTFAKWNELFITWADVYDRAATAGSKDKNLLFELSFQNQAEAWKRLRELELKTHEGVIEGLRRAGIEAPRGLIANLKKTGEVWEAFYNYRRDELRAYWDKPYKDREPFEDVQARISARFEAAYNEVGALRLAVDKSIAKLADKWGGPELAEQVIQYRENVKALRDAMAGAFKDFRESLAALGKLTVNQRRAFYHQFLNDTLGPMMAEFYRAKIEGRHGLNGGEGEPGQPGAGPAGGLPQVPGWKPTPPPFSLVKEYGAMLTGYGYKGLGALIRDLPDINDYLPAGMEPFKLDELRLAPSRARIEQLRQVLEARKVAKEAKAQKVAAAEDTARTATETKRATDAQARQEPEPIDTGMPTSEDIRNLARLIAERKFPGGFKHLFHAVNSDRRAANLEPYATISHVPIADWMAALDKRTGQAPAAPAVPEAPASAFDNAPAAPTGPGEGDALVGKWVQVTGGPHAGKDTWGKLVDGLGEDGLYGVFIPGEMGEGDSVGVPPEHLDFTSFKDVEDGVQRKVRKAEPAAEQGQAPAAPAWAPNSPEPPYKTVVEAMHNAYPGEPNTPVREATFIDGTIARVAFPIIGTGKPDTLVALNSKDANGHPIDYSIDLVQEIRDAKGNVLYRKPAAAEPAGRPAGLAWAPVWVAPEWLSPKTALGDFIATDSQGDTIRAAKRLTSMRDMLIASGMSEGGRFILSDQGRADRVPVLERWKAYQDLAQHLGLSLSDPVEFRKGDYEGQVIDPAAAAAEPAPVHVPTPEEVPLKTLAESEPVWWDELKAVRDDMRDKTNWANPAEIKEVADRVDKLGIRWDQRWGEWPTDEMSAAINEVRHYRESYAEQARDLAGLKVVLPWVPARADSQVPKTALGVLHSKKMGLIDWQVGEFMGERIWASSMLQGTGDFKELISRRYEYDAGNLEPVPQFKVSTMKEWSDRIGRYYEARWVEKIEYAFDAYQNTDMVRFTDESGREAALQRDLYDALRTMYPDVVLSIGKTGNMILGWRGEQLVVNASALVFDRSNKPKGVRWIDTGYKFEGMPSRIGAQVEITKGAGKGQAGRIVDRIETPSGVKYKVEVIVDGKPKFVEKKISELAEVSDEKLPGMTPAAEQELAWRKWNDSLKNGDRVTVAWEDGTTSTGYVQQFWASVPNGFYSATVKLDDGRTVDVARGALRPIEPEAAEPEVAKVMDQVRHEAEVDAAMTQGTPASPDGVEPGEVPGAQSQAREPLPAPAEAIRIPAEDEPNATPEERRVNQELRDLVTKLMAELEETNARANHDSLLGLPLFERNRERVEKAPHKLLIDLVGLKWINDNFDEVVGDNLLIKFRDVATKYGVEVFRLKDGGDEFVIPFNNLDHLHNIEKAIRDEFKRAWVLVDDLEGNQYAWKGFDFYTGNGKRGDLRDALVSLAEYKQQYKHDHPEFARGGKPPEVYGGLIVERAEFGTPEWPGKIQERYTRIGGDAGRSAIQPTGQPPDGGAGPAAGPGAGPEPGAGTPIAGGPAGQPAAEPGAGAGTPAAAEPGAGTSASIIAWPSQQVGSAAKNIAKLLHALGIAGDVLTPDFHAHVKNPPYIDLVIEHLEDKLYFTHYREQNGDLILDGEMVYQINPDGTLKFVETAVLDHRGYEHRAPDIRFGNTFARNLIEQGFGEGELQRLDGPEPAENATPGNISSGDRSREIAEGPGAQPAPGGDYGFDPEFAQRVRQAAIKIFDRDNSLDEQQIVNMLISSGELSGNVAKLKDVVRDAIEKRYAEQQQGQAPAEQQPAAAEPEPSALAVREFDPAKEHALRADLYSYLEQYPHYADDAEMLGMYLSTKGEDIWGPKGRAYERLIYDVMDKFKQAQAMHAEQSQAPTPAEGESREKSFAMMLGAKMEGTGYANQRDFEADARAAGYDLDNESDVNQAYDLLEGVMNEYVAFRRAQLDAMPLAERLAELDKVEARLVTARRTLAKKKLQQFSTPVTISEAAGVLADVRPGDVILEPTAGTGNLVEKFRKRDDVTVLVNEIDPGRRKVLELLGYDPTGIDVLKEEWIRENGKLAGALANVVIENPPWGSYTKGIYGKPTDYPVKGMNDWSQRFFFLIDQRMAKNGRAVIVAPTNWVYSSNRTNGEMRETGQQFMAWLKTNYSVRAIIEAPEGAYSHRGTEVSSLLIVVDKVAPKSTDYMIKVVGADRPQDWAEYAHWIEAVARELPRTEEMVRDGQSAVTRTAGPGVGNGVRPGSVEGLAGAGARPGMDTQADAGRPATSGVAGLPGGDGGSVSEPGATPTGAGQGSARPGTGVEPGQPGVRETSGTGAPVVAGKNGGGRTGAAGAGTLVPSVGARALAQRSSKYREQGREDVRRSDGYSLSTFTGGRELSPHPRPLVEASPLAGIPGPDTTNVEIHPDIWDANARGVVSDDQREAIVRITNALNKEHAIVVADGTGVGKGREVMLTALQMLGAGDAKRILILTKNHDNIHDLMEEALVVSGGRWSDDGRELIQGEKFASPTTGEEYFMVRVDEVPKDTPIPLLDKVVYLATYDNLRDKIEYILPLGIDGLIGDEAHTAKNVFDEKKNGPTKKHSARGEAWTILHQDLNSRNGKAVYFTATPAENIKELAYLWGLNEWPMTEAGFNTWMRYVQGALDEKEYQVALAHANFDEYHLNEVVKLARAGEFHRVPMREIGGWKDEPGSALANSPVVVMRNAKSAKDAPWVVGLVDPEYTRSLLTGYQSFATETEAQGYAVYLDKTYRAALLEVATEDLEQNRSRAQLLNTAKDEYDMLGMAQAKAEGDLSDSQVEILTSGSKTTQGVSGVGVTPAFIEQVMRELKAKGKYMARELWRGDLQYEIKLAEGAAEFFNSSLFTEAIDLFSQIESAYRRWGKRTGASSLKKKNMGPNSMIQGLMRQLVGNILTRDALNSAEELIKQGYKPVLSINYKSDIDPEGGFLAGAINTISTREIVKDEHGNIVYDPNNPDQAVLGAAIPEAIIEVEKLLEKGRDVIGRIVDLMYENDPKAEFYLSRNKLPGPVQQIVDRFGRDKTSLIIGDIDTVEVNGNKLGHLNTVDEMRKFQQGLSDLAVISAKGDTGISLHDKYGNGRRVMIFVDYDWTGTLIMQRLGRIDRADQQTSPMIRFLTLPQAVHKKTLSTVAARMNSLGATSRGGSHAVGVSEFSEGMDLSSDFYAFALRHAWANKFSDELKQAVGDGFVDPGTGIPYKSWPSGKNVNNFLLRLQQFMHPTLSDEAYNTWMSAVEELKNTPEYEEHLERLSAKASGKVLRTTPFTRQDGHPLHLVEVKDQDGKIFGVLSGVFLDQLANIRKALYAGKVAGGVASVKWVAFQDRESGQTVSGIRIGPSQLERVAKLFNATLKGQITPASALEAIKANHKIEVVGPEGAEWTIRQRKDGRIVIDGAKEAQGTLIASAGGKKHISGFYFLPEDAVEGFLNTFRIKQEGADLAELAEASRPYYMNVQGKYEVVPDAEPVTIKGYEDFDLFAHQQDGWTISEGRTGFRLVNGYETKASAIAAMTVRFGDYTPEKFKELIDNAVKTNGLTPRYSQDMGTSGPRPSNLNRAIADQHPEFFNNIAMGDKIVPITPFEHGDTTIGAMLYRDRVALAYIPAGWQGVGEAFDTARGPAKILGLALDDPNVWIVSIGDEIKRMPAIRGASDAPEPAPVADTPAYRFLGQAQDDFYSQHIEPVMAGLRDKMRRTKLSGSAFSKLDEGGAKQLRYWLNKQINKLGDIKVGAMKYGEFKRDMSLLNYSKRYGWDNTVQSIFPYQFFYTRSMLNWAARMIDHPGWLSAYARLQQMHKKFYREGFPTRLVGKVRIPIPFMPDWMGGGAWVDPERQLFPFETFLKPAQQWASENNQVKRRALSQLQRWSSDGSYPAKEIQAAIQQQGGPIWDKAVASAKTELSSELSNPFDFAAMIATPSLPIAVAYNVWKGKNPVNPLPATRMVSAVTTALGVNQGRGWNLEGPIRRALGITEFDDWYGYKVDRELANMAADGLISSDDARRAMIERAGQVFTQAQARVSQASAVNTFGGLAGLPADLLPTGELKDRNLQESYNAAMAAYRAGDPKAAQEWFDEHPEYEARLALWDGPEDRLQQFLVSQVWDRYLSLPSLQKKQVREAFGELFESNFLANKAYTSIEPSTLAGWSRAMGATPPEVAATAPVGQAVSMPDMVPAEDAQAVDAYYDERSKRFPNWDALQTQYYALKPGAQRAAFLQKFPELKDYWGWNRAYKEANPQLKVYLGDSSTANQSGAGLTDVQYQALDPALIRTLALYYYTRQPLGSGTQNELRRVWELFGRPQGSLGAWLNGQLRNTFVPR